ncbi:orotidine 5'-phosphate decarboxylase / HUMPS family protein [Lentilactobacillus laojiaonis]|uniref:orotidine 5'-phosphate decarboxylase / HUMPS family protein n=1 Tax=Lentilactobacillus laojiaonis TaxID=2883998 RepID=UPI001D09D83F|nr:orotidine 5'-phosphate decarboxylase / HUMPS family protein [Lentilactobacillus laojiaonis]UDM32109.1 orotidine 5'-phosphate decarboxylase [Lentilactobacillus laojiaonis]
MKLQVAIDRVSLDYAIELANKLDGIVDVIELGTSLVKDYGLITIKQKLPSLKKSQLLLDLKTIDEGVYEFDKGFETGADILTVMGGASVDTLEKVYKQTEELGKTMLIDLMEINDEKTSLINKFPKAIYGIHHANDSQNDFNAVDTVMEFHKNYVNIQKISIAGGIDLTVAQQLASQGIADYIIVGGSIIKADDPIKAAKKFMEVIR